MLTTLAVGLAYGLVLLLPGWLLLRRLLPDPTLDRMERLGLAFPFSLALLILPASATLALHLNLSAFQWIFGGLMLILVLVSAGQRSEIRGQRTEISDQRSGTWKMRIRRLVASNVQSLVSGIRSQVSNLRSPLSALQFFLLLAALVAAALIAGRGGLDGDQIAYLGFTRPIFENQPLTGLDPLFGTGLPVPPRATLNPWGLIPAFVARLSGVDLGDALGRYLPVFLVLSALASFYTLVKQLTHRQDLARFLASFQVLFFLAAPFHRHGNLAYAFFRRIVSDKFMLLFIVLPVALALVHRVLQNRRMNAAADTGQVEGEVSAPLRLRVFALHHLSPPRDLLLAALGSLPLIIHPIDTAFFAVAAAALAGLTWLVRPGWASLRRSLGVGAIILGLLIFPFLLRQQVAETRSAYLFPASFANLPLQEAPELVLPFVWRDALQMPGPQPAIVTPAPGAANPFLLYRLWSQINGQGLLIFSPQSYMSHPDLLWDNGVLLALLLAPLALLRLRRSPLARFILAATVPFLLIAFTPWLAPLVGRVVTPWMLYRFTWPLPIALILGSALFFGLQRLVSGLRSPVSRLLPSALLILLTLLSLPAIRGRMQTFAATLDVPRTLPASVVTALRQLPADAVILSDYETNQIIPATVSRRYVVAHRYTTTSEEFPASRQAEAIQRAQDVDAFTRARFVDGPLLDTLARYHTNLILLRDTRELAWQLRTLAASSPAPPDLQITRLFARDGFELYRVISPTAPSLVITGNTLLGQQRWTEAADTFRRALAAENSAIAWYGLGQALFALSDLNAAADAFVHASDLQSPLILSDLARIAAAQARPEDALALYARAVAADSTHGEWFQEMGDLALLLDRPDEAAAAYARAIGAAAPPDTLTFFSKLAPLLGSKGLTEPAVQAYNSALRLSPNDLDFLAPLGNLLAERGRLGEAESVFRRALSIDPTAPTGYVGLATVTQRQGRYAEAETWYRRAVIVQQARLVSPLDTLLAWGQLMQTQGRFEQARAHFQQALRLAPHDARGYIALGNLALQAADAAPASVAPPPAVEAAPVLTPTLTLTATLAARKEQQQEAENWYRQAMLAAPRDPAGYAALARAQQNQGQLAAALVTAQQGADAIAANMPGADAARQTLGDLQQAAGQLDAAADSYRSAIEINARNVGAHINLARVAMRQGEPTRALAAYQAAARAAPYSAWALSALAAAHARLADPAAAQILYRRAIAVDQSYTGAFSNLALLLAAQGDWQAAADLLAAGLQANPASAALLTARGDLQRSRGDFQAAQASYQASLALDPTASAAAANLTLLLSQRGEPVQALAVAQAAVNAAPLSGEGWVLLGNLRRSQGDLPGALAAYRQASAVAGGFQDAYLALADALVVSGQPAEAAAVLQQGLQAAPGPELYVALGNLAARQRDPRPTAADHFTAALASDRTSIAATIGLASVSGSPSPTALLERAVALNPASAWARTALAAALRNQGAWDAAEAQFRQALVVEPLYAAGYTSLAAALLARGERDAAWEVLQAALKIAPADAEVQTAWGQWYLHGGHYTAAQDAFTRAQQLDRTVENAPVGLAQAWLAAGDRHQALAVLAAAAQDIPASSAVWLLAGNLLEALPAAVRSNAQAAGAVPLTATLPIDQTPIDPAAAYRQASQRDASQATPWLALAAWRQRSADPEGAQAALARAADLEPHNPAVIIAQAEALQAQGQITPALTLLLDAHQRLPGFPDLLVALAGLTAETRDQGSEIGYVQDANSPLDGLQSPASDLLSPRALLEQALALDPANAAANLALADLERRAGRAPQAIARLQAAVQLDPANPGLLIALANLEGRRDPQAAQARLQEAIHRNPGLGWPLTVLAGRESSAGESSAAEAHLRQATQLDPAFGGAAQILGQQYQRQGRLAEAEAVLTRALAFDASNTSAAVTLADLWTRQGRITETVALLQQTSANHPAAPAPLIALGNFLQDHPVAGLQSPLSAYTLAVTRAPASADARVALANWLQTQGERQQAGQMLQEGLARTPNDPGLHLAIGQWRLSNADPIGARLAFSQAVALDQSRADGWLGLAQAWQASGERTLAVQALQRATEADPTDPAPWLVYGQGLAAGRLPALTADLADPAAAFAQAAALNRSLAAPYLGLAAWQQRQGRWSQALAALEQAAAREPANTAIALARAAAWRQQNRPDLALATLTQTLQTTPGALEVMVALADLTRAGLADARAPAAALDNSRAWLAQALALSPDSTAALVVLADVEARRGQRPAAQARLAAALERRPGDAAIALALAGLQQAAGQPDTAVAVLQNAQARQPANPALPLALAALRRQQGQPDKARDLCTQAAGLTPLSAAPWLGLAQLETSPVAVAAHLARAQAADPADSAAALALGQFWLTQGDLTTAAAAFEAGLTLNPTSPGAYLNLAQAAERRGQPAAQRAWLAKAVAAAPASGWARASLGNAYRSQGDWAQAESAYRAALAVEPAYSGAATALASLLAEQGRFGEAQALLQTAAAFDAGDPAPRLAQARVAEMAGQPAEALRLAGEAATQAPASGWAWATLGDLARGQGRLDEAARAYRAGIAADPLYSGGYSGLSSLQLAQGQPTAALGVLQQGLRLAPNAPGLLVSQGHLLRRQGQADAARRAYEAAIAADAGNPNGLLALGQWFEAQGSADAALARYQAAARLPGAAALALTGQAGVYRNLGQMEQAIALYRQALAAPGDFSVAAAAGLDQALLALGRGAEGLTIHLAVAAQRPSNPAPQVALGDAYRRRGRLAEAMQAYQAALALQPGNQAALLALAAAQQADGRLNEAEISLKTAAALRAGSAGLYVTWGDARWAAGDATGATARFEQALALDAAQAAPLARLGVLAQLQGRPDEALALFRRAAEADPLNLVGYIQQGQALAQAGDFDAARAVYAAAGATNRGSAVPLILTGNTYLAQNNLAAAAAAFQAAIQAEPGNVAGYINLSNVYRQERRYDEALAQIELAQRLNPGAGWAWEAAGNVMRQQRKLEEAVGLYEQALQRDPRRISAVNALASIFKGWRALPDYAARYEAQLAQEGQPAWIHALLAGIYQALDQVEPAIQHNEALLASYPEYADPYFALARFYQRTGDGRAAAAAWQRYLALMAQSASDARLEAEASLQRLNLVTIESPAAGARVSGEVGISGTAAIENFQYYKIEWGAGESPTDWNLLVSAATPVSQGLLATWNTAGLAPGVYTLRLTVVDITGNFPPPFLLRVSV